MIIALTVPQIAALRVIVSHECHLPLTAEGVDLIDTVCYWAQAVIAGEPQLAGNFTAAILEQWTDQADTRLVMTVVRETLRMREGGATSHQRGHAIRWDGACWRYADTGEPATDERPCTACHQPPTPAGYDACLGHLPYASSACCGHGVHPPFLIADVPVGMESGAPNATGGAGGDARAGAGNRRDGHAAQSAGRARGGVGPSPGAPPSRVTHHPDPSLVSGPETRSPLTTPPTR